MGKHTCLTPILEGKVHSYSHCGEDKEEWPIFMDHNETITNKMLSYCSGPPQKNTRLLRSVTVVWDLLSCRFDRLQEIPKYCSCPELTQKLTTKVLATYLSSLYTLYPPRFTRGSSKVNKGNESNAQQIWEIGGLSMMLKAGNLCFKFGLCEIKLKHIENRNYHILEVYVAATIFLEFF